MPEGGGEASAAVRDAMWAVRMGFARADQRVFYGMGVAFLVALRHPGGRTGAALAPRDERRPGAPTP
ncbi:hypothetical protein ACFYQA_26675 [Streptomyces sp. NPDC005774]|uniref:hypothetical protein n=1 Tax=Streptomyces sp. NPDC005774 TaxID=3364728 RepID=UPI00368E9DEB